MPDKPIWYGRLDSIIAELETLPCPWIDRAAVEQVLCVGRRRAQQILAPCITRRVGASGVAERSRFITHLRSLAAGETAFYEQQRRRKVARHIDELRQAWLEQPRVMVEAPAAVANQRFAQLPDGVSIGPGRITIDFPSPQGALEKLLALAMAIGNDMDQFEALSSLRRNQR